MSDRSFTRASWASFAALVAVLHLLGSCAGVLDGSDDASADPPTATAAGTTTGSAAPASTAAAPPAGSGPDAGPAGLLPPADNPDRLSAWNQLVTREGRLVLADGVTPYTLNSPLFSDYAHKLRTVWIPEGAGAAGYQPDRPFDFPVGTVVTKTFYYPEPDGAELADGEVLKTDPPSGLVESLGLDDVRLVETRVLVRRQDGWHGLPYVWNAEETDATLQRTGAILQLTLVDDDHATDVATGAATGAAAPLTYVVPDVNQCASCHATNHSTGAIEPIGLQARHLNTEVDLGGRVASQLDLWRELGLLTGAPEADQIPKAAVWDDDSASLESRARAYLEINCAHCHNPAGAADTSGLMLDRTTEIGPSFGVCKAPIAAGGGTGGRLVDIVPGEPDESILVYRMETTDPGAMMPELGRSTTHTEGVDLIAEWIESLQGSC
jgi:uncharacterized repeat protein (TIGR03806 family)